MGVIALIAIYYLQSILTPFLIGIILAYLGDPVVDRLVKYKVNRTFSVLIVFVVFLVVMVGGGDLLLPHYGWGAQSFSLPRGGGDR